MLMISVCLEPELVEIPRPLEVYKGTSLRSWTVESSLDATNMRASTSHIIVVPMEVTNYQEKHPAKEEPSGIEDYICWHGIFAGLA